MLHCASPYVQYIIDYHIPCLITLFSMIKYIHIYFLVRNNDTSAWIYHKRRGEPAQYDKIGGTASSDIFKVQSRTERTISVKHQPSSLSTVFIAPVATFSGIHSKSVSRIAVFVVACWFIYMMRWQYLSSFYNFYMLDNFSALQVISLGVGEGGLGVSVCTDNKLHVWETQTGIIRVSTYCFTFGLVFLLVFTVG